PRIDATVLIPASGERRFRSMSDAKALSGDTYRTRRRSRSSGTGSVASRSRAQRKAARVLPEPVGATTNASSPDAMASQAPSCAGVGDGNAPWNHVRVRSEKRSRAAGLMRPILARPGDNEDTEIHASHPAVSSVFLTNTHRPA